METFSERMARYITPALFVLGVTTILVIYMIYGRQGGRIGHILPPDLTKIQYVQASQDLRFPFDEEMDKKSVEENLIIPDGVSGEISWDETTMVFSPDENLDSGQKYAFSILRKAKTKKAKNIGKDMGFSFIVAGIPKLISRIPAIDATQVPNKSRITLIFDRPMTPLTQVQGEASEKRLKNWPVTISPPLDGRWRWLGTTSIVFEADEGLQFATRYTVTVPSGIASVSGDRTEEDFSWSFETERPMYFSLQADNDHGRFGPSSNIVLIFDMPMSLKGLEENLELFQVGEDGDKVVVPINKLKYSMIENGRAKVTEEQTVLVQINPKNNLSFDTKYIVKIRAGSRATEGDLGTPEDYERVFQTVGPMKVGFVKYEYYTISVGFSNPVGPASLKKSISITPKPESWDEKDKEIPGWSNGDLVSFHPELKPRTTYTVHISTDLTDVFGQNMQEPYEYKFTTDPVKPKVFIKSKGEFGLFEKNKPPVYFLNAVNVSKLNIDFATLSLEEFINIRNKKQEQYDFSPDLSQYSGYQALSLDPPKKTPDEWGVEEFQVEKAFGKLKSGIYALTLQSPEYRESYGKKKPIINEQYFALTNMALTLKYSGSKALIWLVDTQTGSPIPNAEISFHSLNGEVPIRGKTNREGFLEKTLKLEDFVTSYNYSNPEFYVTAEKDGDFTFVGSYWNEGFLPYSFGMKSDFTGVSRQDYVMQSYIYTERPLYRAGESVNFKGIIRLREQKTGTLFLPKKSRQVLLSIIDSRYQEVYSKIIDINEFGSFSGTMDISGNAALGDYRIILSLSPGADVAGNSADTTFSVLTYRKPEYRVEIKPEKEDYFDDQTLKFTIAGSYYFGAPLDGAKIEWRAISTDYFFNRYTDGYYSFALEDSWCWWGCERKTEIISKGSGKLDESGRYSVKFPYNMDDKSLSQIISLEADVYDPNNQIVSNRVSVPVHKAKVYVGIRTEDYVVASGEEARLEIVTVSPDGTAKAKQKVNVKMFSREWNSIRKKGVDGEYYYDNEPEDTFLKEKTVTSNEEGKAVVQFQINKGGQYRMLAIAIDEDGRKSISDTSIYGYSSSFVNWPRANNDRIDIIADKPEYKLGDVAKLLVKSPFQGKNVKALVTLEREQIMSREVITVESNAQPIEIKITEEMIPNVYVSVVIIKPREGETFNENGVDTGAPAFRIGYKKLLVDTASKESKVSLTTDREKYGPGETVKVTLKTTDWKGAPISSEVSLGVVDMSVLALSGFRLPDLVKRFYSERGLGINTAQTLLYLIERFKPGSKGGGGGDVSERKKRGNFKDTAYWNPSIITDEKGEASVSFDLPDNLTTWQLLAIANSKLHQFGAKDKEIIETKKVILRPVRPRFAVADDQVKIGAIVHNFMDETKTFKVSLKGKGFLSDTSLEKTLVLKPNGKDKVLFDIRIEYGEKATFIFKAETDGAVDEVEESIPVYIFGTPQVVATSGQTDKGVTESILVPTAKDAREGKLSVLVSPTLASFLPKGLEYIIKYPFGCAEQVMSSFLPSVVMANLQGFEAFRIVDKDRLADIVSVGLQKLYKYQRPDGGFGYWEGSEDSYPYLSAYILFGLYQAQKAGFHIDVRSIERAKVYMKTALRAQNLEDPIELATRAYILFVISETGSSDASLINNLYNKKDDLSVFARAMLAMVLQKEGTKTSMEKAKSMLENILQLAKVDARGTHFEEAGQRGFYGSLMNTNTRTTAYVLQAMIRIQPDHPLIPRVVRYLLAVREEGHWDTTQSTSVTLLALIEFLKSTGELKGDFEAMVQLNDETILNKRFNSSNILTQEERVRLLEQMKRGQENLLKIGKKGKGRLYYDIAMSYFYLADKIPPAEEGIGIRRSMEPVSVKNKEKVTVGDTYKVTLSMTVPADRHFVAAESPLPAGMELIDLRLKTSQQGLYEGALNKSNADMYQWDNLRYFIHSEFRDDRLVLFADYLPTGVYEYEYLVRATTPGKFRYRPARIYEMYFPETFGQTNGGWFEIDSE